MRVQDLQQFLGKFTEGSDAIKNAQIFVEVNGEKDEGTLQKFESDHKVSITAYPTIYLVKGNNVVEFSTDITEDNLTKFLNTAL